MEDGVTDLDDMLEDRLAALKADRDRAQVALDRMHAAERPPGVIAPELITQFGQLMRTNLTEGTILFRKAWLQSIVDRVEVGAETVRIKVCDEGIVRNKAMHIALGVRADGAKEILGLWLEQNEGAKFCAS